MRTIVIAAIALALATPVHAQGIGSKPMYDNKTQGKSEAELAQERREEAQREQAARKALSRVPDRDVKLDPWSNIR